MSGTILRAYADYPQQLLAVVTSGRTSAVRGRNRELLQQVVVLSTLLGSCRTDAQARRALEHLSRRDDAVGVAARQLRSGMFGQRARDPAGRGLKGCSRSETAPPPRGTVPSRQRLVFTIFGLIGLALLLRGAWLAYSLKSGSLACSSQALRRSARDLWRAPTPWSASGEQQRRGQAAALSTVRSGLRAPGCTGWAHSAGADSNRASLQARHRGDPVPFHE